jgi:hypothetical protein
VWGSLSWGFDSQIRYDKLVYGVWTVKSDMTRVYMKRRNRDDVYGVGKTTPCETMFEGVLCLSFSRQYKVAITSNAPSKFDLNVRMGMAKEPSFYYGYGEPYIDVRIYPLVNNKPTLTYP